jgi:hypothetical protein
MLVWGGGFTGKPLAVWRSSCGYPVYLERQAMGRAEIVAGEVSVLLLSSLVWTGSAYEGIPLWLCAPHA